MFCKAQGHVRCPFTFVFAALTMVLKCYVSHKLSANLPFRRLPKRKITIYQILMEANTQFKAAFKNVNQGADLTGIWPKGILESNIG